MRFCLANVFSVLLLVTATITSVHASSSSATQTQEDFTAGDSKLNPDDAQAPTLPIFAQRSPYAPLESLFTTMTRIPGGRVYHNLWWHNHAFFGVVDTADMMREDLFDEGLSVGQVVTRLPVANISAFVSSTRLAYVAGASTLVDYPFLSLPDHLGHWAEIMVPLFSVLRKGEWRRAVAAAAATHAADPTAAAAADDAAIINHVVMPNLNRDVKPWLRVVLQITLQPGLPKGVSWPTFIDYTELFSYDSVGWLLFQNVIVADDRYTHPQAKRGFVSTDHGDLWRNDNCQRWISPTVAAAFATPEDGRDFRDRIWTLSGMGHPPPWEPGTPPSLPKHLTLMLGAGDAFPGIENLEELETQLQAIALENNLKVLTVSVGAGASFGSHLAPMTQSAVVIGRHSLLMANTMFLPPGAMVFELLPYKWEWANISKLYFNITRSIGDIHHFAWRPQHYRFAKFKNESDLRYHTWTPEECEAYECLNKMREARIIADIPVITDLLKRKIPAVLRGESIESLQEPWPKAV